MVSSQSSCSKKGQNVVIMCGTDNLHLDAPENITDDIIEIELTLKRLYININAFVCGFLPRDYWQSINQDYINGRN